MSDEYRSLAERFASTGAKIMAYEGRAQLKIFADTYPTECRLEQGRDAVVFGTETESFELLADVNATLDTVYCGRIVTYTPQQVAFDTGWKSDINQAMDALLIGAANIYGNRKAKAPNMTPPPKAKVLEFRRPGGNKKGVKIVTAAQAMTALRKKLKNALENDEDTDAAKPVLQYYKKRRALLFNALPNSITIHVERALKAMDDDDAIVKAIEAINSHFDLAVNDEKGIYA